MQSAKVGKTFFIATRFCFASALGFSREYLYRRADAHQTTGMLCSSFIVSACFVAVRPNTADSVIDLCTELLRPIRRQECSVAVLMASAWSVAVQWNQTSLINLLRRRW